MLSNSIQKNLSELHVPRLIWHYNILTLPWNIYLIGLYLKLSSHHIVFRIVSWYRMYLNYSVCSLTQLEDLKLSWNKKLTTLPDRVGDLKSLKKLNGSNCNITQLPDRWANKSFHDLSPHHNWFFVHTLIDGTLTITYNLINVHVTWDFYLGWNTFFQI